jgi:hypothetical protein
MHGGGRLVDHAGAQTMCDSCAYHSATAARMPGGRDCIVVFGGIHEGESSDTLQLLWLNAAADDPGALPPTAAAPEDDRDGVGRSWPDWRAAEEAGLAPTQGMVWWRPDDVEGAVPEGRFGHSCAAVCRDGGAAGAAETGWLVFVGGCVDGSDLLRDGEDHGGEVHVLSVLGGGGGVRLSWSRPHVSLPRPYQLHDCDTRPAVCPFAGRCHVMAPVGNEKLLCFGRGARLSNNTAVLRWRQRHGGSSGTAAMTAGDAADAHVISAAAGTAAEGGDYMRIEYDDCGLYGFSWSEPTHLPRSSSNTTNADAPPAPSAESPPLPSEEAETEEAAFQRRLQQRESPRPRLSHVGVLAGRQLVVFGGWSQVELDDVQVLDLAAAATLPQWSHPWSERCIYEDRIFQKEVAGAQHTENEAPKEYEEANNKKKQVEREYAEVKTQEKKAESEYKAMLEKNAQETQHEEPTKRRNDAGGAPGGGVAKAAVGAEEEENEDDEHQQRQGKKQRDSSSSPSSPSMAPAPVAAAASRQQAAWAAQASLLSVAQLEREEQVCATGRSVGLVPARPAAALPLRPPPPPRRVPTRTMKAGAAATAGGATVGEETASCRCRMGG